MVPDNPPESPRLTPLKLLKERYKTYDGAHKRCGFENGVAKGEFEQGYKAKHYRYTVVSDAAGMFRVARHLAVQP